MGLLSLYNHMSQLLIINLLLYIWKIYFICIFVLFLWRNLIWQFFSTFDFNLKFWPAQLLWKPFQRYLIVFSFSILSKIFVFKNTVKYLLSDMKNELKDTCREINIYIQNIRIMTYHLTKAALQNTITLGLGFKIWVWVGHNFPSIANFTHCTYQIAK